MTAAAARVGQTWRDRGLTNLLVLAPELTGSPGLLAPLWADQDLPRVSGTVDVDRWPLVAEHLPSTAVRGEVWVAPEDLTAARHLGHTLRRAALASGMRTGAVLVWDHVPVEIVQAWVAGRSEEPHPAAACWLALIGGLHMPHLMAAYPSPAGLSVVLASVPR